MARVKGAIGYEIGTSKLGAYTADDTLDIFEEFGYVKENDLDKFFTESYVDFENRLSLEEFVEQSKRNLLRSLKYREFVSGNAKFCSKCLMLKPLSSYGNHKGNIDGKDYYCRCCKNKYQKKYYQEKDRDRAIARSCSYFNQNKEKLYSYRSNWIRQNRDKKNITQLRWKMKSYLLKKDSNIMLNTQKLDRLIALKKEFDIMYYDDFFERFKGAIYAN